MSPAHPKAGPVNVANILVRNYEQLEGLRFLIQFRGFTPGTGIVAVLTDRECGPISFFDAPTVIAVDLAPFGRDEDSARRHLAQVVAQGRRVLVINDLLDTWTSTPAQIDRALRRVFRPRSFLRSRRAA